ncbi:MAG: BrnT family toxin [Pseudolabrys sp.]|nr:BrnT family toxin [Pseudolabrys sp.]
MPWKITFDPAKREWTLRVRGLDFPEAPIVFDGTTIDEPDDRYDYGELRIITIGHLRGRMIVFGWTPRGAARHIFSMRKTNEREKKLYGQEFEARRQRHEES